MDVAANIETLQQYCRGCLQKGDANIWNFKVKINRDYENGENMGDSMDLYILQIMNIFSNGKHEILDLTEEFPLFCLECLEDLKFCYLFYEKLKLANIQLKKLYNDTLNQYVEEHLIEPIEEEEKQDLKEMIEIGSIDKCKEPQTQSIEIVPRKEEFKTFTTKPRAKPKTTNNFSRKLPLDKNSAFITTQFIHTVLEKPQANFSSQTKLQEGENEYQPPPQHLVTMDYKVVEVKDIKNLQTSLTILTKDYNDEPAIYICQHCPQAFAKSEYLKTHIQNSHVCKFCTQPFTVTEDLFKHLREVHTEHKCVICLKNLSSNTNLRHHIRRVHRINLPAKVALIDYIKSPDMVVENIKILMR